ncbi:MAG TPA: thioredoxin domain-containing protein [Terriglobales bacterium]|nr:thioredoxin domain-containing protein [Terriglobales bacterium]
MSKFLHRYYFVFLCMLAMAGSFALFGQDTKASILRPPAGSKIALIVFEDLECPQCSRTQPVVDEAKKDYKIPVIVYDFPLPQHDWSYQAAILAHYFRSKSTKTNNLEAAFRDYIYQNQVAITPGNLRSYAEKFAQQHKVALPFAVDPEGKFAAEIKADREKAMVVGINHTPTVYVVTNNPAQPFTEVGDTGTLFQTIDGVMAQLK